MTELDEKEYVKQMRQDCLDSLYIFAKVCCGFKDLTDNLHREVCEWLQTDPAIRKVLQMPRDHFKSSLGIAYIMWRLMHDPNERIIIAGDTATTAQGKLNKIRQMFNSSEMLHALFPERIPEDAKKEGEKLPGSQEALTIPRDRAHEEPSIRATGTTGARAGAHYTLIVCDDIYTKEAKEQPATAKKILNWVDNVESLLERPYRDEVVLIGTPWHHEDVYEHVAGREGTWKYGDVENFYSELRKPFFDEEGEPIFPELYESEPGAGDGRKRALDFAERMAKTNPYLWTANYLLDPQVPDAEFDEDDLQYYALAKNERYLLYRPEEAEEPTVVPIEKGEVYIAIDPAFTKSATASKAAINVSLVAPDGNIFVLESIGMRQGTNALIDKVCDLVTKYQDNLRKIGVEKAGQQQSFIDYLQRELRRRGIYRKVDALPRGSKASKEARIRSILQPYFAQKRVWIRVNMKGLLSEFRKFPLTEVRDELDAMAYAADNYWKHASGGHHQNYEEYIERYEQSRKTASRTTGY